jgi:hypothetical protein
MGDLRDESSLGVIQPGGQVPSQEDAHAAVATFWASFDRSTPEAEVIPPKSEESADPSGIEMEAAAAQEPEESPDATSAPPADLVSLDDETEALDSMESGESALEESLDTDITQAGAMQEALAAARAEIAAADDEPVSAPAVDYAVEHPEHSRRAQPVKFTREFVEQHAKPNDQAQNQEPSRSEHMQLDPETAGKLKLLRRLNPGKSVEALLAQIKDEQPNTPAAKQKRSWFSLG